MSNEDHDHDEHESAHDPDVKPLSWKDARAQTRVREQFDAAKVAQKYLDDMEAGGRLHHQNKKK